MAGYVLRLSGAEVAEHGCTAPDDVEARRFFLTEFAAQIVQAKEVSIFRDDGQLIWSRR